MKFETPDEVLPEDEPIVEIATEEPIEEPVTEVLIEELPSNDYLPPNNNEYLPPKSEEAKRKRQVQGRKVYRRFAKKH